VTRAAILQAGVHLIISFTSRLEHGPEQRERGRLTGQKYKERNSASFVARY
jgi:hypothetical protein